MKIKARNRRRKLSNVGESLFLEVEGLCEYLRGFPKDGAPNDDGSVVQIFSRSCIKVQTS